MSREILITGMSSYIGNSLKRWLEGFAERYTVKMMSLRNELWKAEDFSGVDVLVHAAGIAHVKETEANRELYYKINKDLAYAVALKAKEEGVKQFVFLSTMAVYGSKSEVIHQNTIPDPSTIYGKSKYEAERLILELNDDRFKVSILRIPMVYGNNCKGNYVKLSKLARYALFFPGISNMRSMIYIDNLSECIRLLIDCRANGVFFPQNKDYVCTSSLVSIIANCHGKKVKMLNFVNGIVMLCARVSNTFKKVFGNLVYDKKLAGGPGTLVNGQLFNYETRTFEMSIADTEGTLKE